MSDQPNPTPNEHPIIQDLVSAYLLEHPFLREGKALAGLVEERKQRGMSAYGTALQPFNGRNAHRDALEEAVDLMVYLRQLVYEAEHSDDTIKRGEQYSLEIMFRDAVELTERLYRLERYRPGRAARQEQ